MSTGMLKNAGLACTRIVRTAGELQVARLLPFGSPDLETLRSRAALGVVRYWGEFLGREDARRDPSFGAIAGVMEHVGRASRK